MPDSLTLADLAALRARYTSPPAPCPVCGTPRVEAFDPEDSVEHWTCPAVSQGPPPPFATDDDFDHRWAEYRAALARWIGSPEGQAARAHEEAAYLSVYPDPLVIALVDAYAALEVESPVGSEQCGDA